MSIKAFFKPAPSGQDIDSKDTVVGSKRRATDTEAKSTNTASNLTSTVKVDDSANKKARASTGSSSPQKVVGTTSSGGGGNSTVVARNSTVEARATDASKLWDCLSHLNSSWRELLKDEFSKRYFRDLAAFVDQEMARATVYPPRNEMFTALNLCELDKIKVVIIGQDPYHGPDQAHGLAFSVRKGQALPPSLSNIFKEAISDVGIRMPTHGNLESWSKQGVLLLNTSLSVRKAEPNSHQKHGWETFTDAIIQKLRGKTNIVYLLWGKPAQSKCASIDSHRNTIISTSHPSPLGAYKTDAPFIGSKCFSRCNAALAKYNISPINWQT